MKFDFLALSINCAAFLLLLLIAQSESILVNNNCPSGSRKDSNGRCRRYLFSRTFSIVPTIKPTVEPLKNHFDFKAPEICGKRLAIKPHVIGGTSIYRGEFPWNVALVDKNSKLFCGGTLISNKIIVTAAHCIKGKYSDGEQLKPEDVSARIGAHNLTKSNEVGRITANIKTIEIHPDWNVNNLIYDADIAILELENEIEFNNFIQPICLSSPTPGIVDAYRGQIVGYGRNDNNNLGTPNIAIKLDVSIKDHLSCTKDSEGHQGLISNRNICGGPADGRGICDGDSGSGLYISYNRKFYLRGIVSASLSSGEINQCNVDSYGIYTNVVNFYKWINSNGLDKY